MSLHIAPPERYPALRTLIDPDGCGAVYAYAVAEGIQSGILYTDENETVLLVRHVCGFALLFGDYTEDTLREIGEMIRQPAPFSRMILFAPDDRAAAYFSNQDDFITEQRLFFRYSSGEIPPESSAAEHLTPARTEQISGRITPSFSWDNMDDFAINGTGYCIMQDGVPAAWAFSAAVSSRETDIGVETHENYRRRGFAFAAASAMIRDTLLRGKQPVWACHAENTGSRKLAEALGFSVCGQCTTVRRRSE